MSGVTAIIPTKDRPKFLKRALQSVLNQTYEQVQVIIIDASQNDQTYSIVKSFDNNSIEYIQSDAPRGPAAARNQGLQIADTKYVAFLDDDDFWHSEKIKTQIEELRKNPGRVAGVYCGRRTVNPDGDCKHVWLPTREGDLYKNVLVEDIIGSPSMVLVRSKAACSIDGFDEEMDYYEDWDFHIRFSRDFEWACVNDALVTRTSSVDARSNNVNLMDEYGCKLLRKYTEELRKHKLEDRAWQMHFQNMGIAYCNQGEINKGRRMFKKSLSEKSTTTSAFLYMVTFTGHRGFHLLRWLKQRLSRLKKVDFPILR